MSTPTLLDAKTLAAELAKLPNLIAPTPAQTSEVQLALASAIASGQSADEITQALNSIGVSQAAAPAATQAVSQTVFKAATAAPASVPALPAAEPEWIAKTVPLALASTATTRVAVLDHAPTALGGLELPAWARALRPSALIGPVHLGTAAAGAPEKFIITFKSTETYTFVRSGITLCVLPVTTIRHGLLHPVETIGAGLVWLAVKPIDGSAPDGTFAGFTMQSGTYTCDQPLSFASTTVEVPANATLSFTFVPSIEPSGVPGVTITAPGKITVSYPPTTGPGTVGFDTCAATVFGDPLHCTFAGQAATWNAALQILYIPGTCTPSVFAPPPGTGTLLTLTGSAPILSGGWAIQVSTSTSPATLGTASGPGDFAFAFGAGVSSQWTGLSRPEVAAGGFLIAGTDLLLEIFSGSPPGVLVQQRFGLWNDQDTGKNGAAPVRCQLVLARGAGQSLIYAQGTATETLILAGGLAALVDRPLAATGARLTAAFVEGLVTLSTNQVHNRLTAISTAPVVGPTQTPAVFPLALDNAILNASGPTLIYVYGNADEDFNLTHGGLLFTFNYILRELYLPDPYTGTLTYLGRDVPAAGNFLEGVLDAVVTWTDPGDATLRLADTAHTQPAAPPTTEAGSPPYPTVSVSPIHLPPVHVPAPAPVHLALDKNSPAVAKGVPAEAKAAPEAAVAQTVSPQDKITPPPDPLPDLPPGAVLLDLSTRASQLGVTVTLSAQQTTQFSIDGLSVRGPASLLPLTTLPAIAWEPMYNRSTAVDSGVDPNTLLHPPDDGPFTQIASNSATLIPISPLQSLRAVLDAGPGGFNAQITMPFGMVAVLDDQTANGTVLPSLVLTQPAFAAGTTPSGALYTGAWQVSVLAPDQTQPDPVLAGTTYLRTQTDQPPYPALSYGEQVLGTDAAQIFSSRFDPPAGSNYGTGVPLRRYDLTGYGASTFSEWTNTTPAPTDVLKAFFHVLVGRTSHEVIQVQSVIYPWKINVVRTITIDRRGSGVVERYDSGWQPAGDGFFQYGVDIGVDPTQVHSGLVGGLIKVRNIQQLGAPFMTMGTKDGTDAGGPVRMQISVQAVTLDADVVIPPQHIVLKGGQTSSDYNGVSHTCVPATGITGYIGLQYDFHLSMADMVESRISDGCGAPFKATINVAGSNSITRATEFSVTAVGNAFKTGSPLGLVGAVSGFPTLSSDGSWSVAALYQGQPAPISLDPTQAVPLIQPNPSGQAVPGPLVHFADPRDIFSLDPGSAVPPFTKYGFLQATGTQSNFLSRPILTVGSKNLTLGDALNVAHAGALLGAISHFPGIAQCLQFASSELQPITNQLSAPSLATTQNLNLQPAVKNGTLPLISTSIANVGLHFVWTDPQNDNTNPDVVISLGQPASPSWSFEVNHIAVALQVPALGSTPIMWLEGAFHADADTTPAFPNLKVVFDGPLQPLTEFFTVLEDIASVLSPGSGGTDLNVHFADGKLSVTDNFSLPSIPLGPGTIQNVSLDIGSTLDIVGLDIDFLVGIGTPDAPCQWIVDPLTGTVCIQAGVEDNQLAVLIQGGIGLGLAIDLGIASGSASIVISVQISIMGQVITLMLLLTGQAQVDVLGGLASAAITLTAGLGFSINLGNHDIDVIGTAQVGIHISICWIISINFSGSWTFQKQLPHAG